MYTLDTDTGFQEHNKYIIDDRMVIFTIRNSV